MSVRKKVNLRQSKLNKLSEMRKLVSRQTKRHVKLLNCWLGSERKRLKSSQN